MITRLIWTIWTSLSAVPRKAVKFNHSLTRMVSADSSGSVTDQVIQFTALFVIWFPYFQYKRLIKNPGPQGSTYPINRWPSSSKITSVFEQVFFYIVYKQNEKMHNFTSRASKKLRCALVFERQEGQHFADSIKSWHLVIHDLRPRQGLSGADRYSLGALGKASQAKFISCSCSHVQPIHLGNK